MPVFGHKFFFFLQAGKSSILPTVLTASKRMAHSETIGRRHMNFEISAFPEGGGVNGPEGWQA